MRISGVLALALTATSILSAADHWVATWGASPSAQLADEAQMRAAHLVFSNQTVREIVRGSIGGTTVRIRLSNAHNRETVNIGAAHLALRAKDSGIAGGSDRALTFSGRQNIVLPPDAVAISDPVKLAVPAGADVVVSLFIPGTAMAGGIHYGALQTSYTATGDVTGAPTLTEPATFASWAYLAGVDVMAADDAGTLVTFGDSITDGTASTPNSNRRWPNALEERLRARKGAAAVGLVNAGIGGNRVLHDAVPNLIRFGVNAMARFDRDVLAQPGVKYVVVMEGINDIGFPPGLSSATEEVTAEDVIAGHRQLIERAHERGLKIIGATLTPFEGAAYYTTAKEVKRKAVNEWIRTGKAYDGVIDFDEAVRDPANPLRFLPVYDGGDHLHPSDAGYKAMAAVIDLTLFR